VYARKAAESDPALAKLQRRMLARERW
jgi:hypothetical protein